MTETDLNTLSQEVTEALETMDEDIYAILWQRANQIKDIAQSIVRVRTGTLRSDIRVEIEVRSETQVIISVKAGGTQVNPETGRLCDYAAYVESKYPFLAPAVAMVDMGLDSDIKNLFKGVMPAK